jgi:hypothetical protein
MLHTFIMGQNRNFLNRFTLSSRPAQKRPAKKRSDVSFKTE